MLSNGPKIKSKIGFYKGPLWVLYSYVTFAPGLPVLATDRSRIKQCSVELPCSTNPLPLATLVNGACHRVAPNATAFGHRGASLATVIAGMWKDPQDNQENMPAFGTTCGHRARGRLHFMAGDDQEHVAHNYGASYGRLIDIKEEIRCG